MASLNRKRKSKLLITLHGLIRTNLKTAGFHRLIKSLAMITDQGKLVRDRSLVEFQVSKTATKRDSAYEKQIKRRNELQGEEYFRKRIEKRSVRFKISNTIPESFRLFVPHEKSELSEEKTIQTTNWSLSRKASKILYPCKATVGITVISASCLFDFRFFKKSGWMFRKRASLTARQRSLDFHQLRKIHESDYPLQSPLWQF